MSYNDDFKKWVKDNNVKVGDEIKIINTDKPDEWENNWVDKMKNIPAYNTIKKLTFNNKGGLEFHGCVYTFPYTCIELIKEKELSAQKWMDGYNLKVGDYVTVNKPDTEKANGYKWLASMKKFLGEYARIIEISKDSLKLELDDSTPSFYFPIQWLQPVKTSSYQERFQKWKRDNDVKIGDKIVIDSLTVHSDCPNIVLRDINPGEEYKIVNFSNNFIQIELNSKRAYSVPFECVELVKNTPKISLTKFTDELSELIEEYKWNIPFDSHGVIEYGDRSHRKLFYGTSGKAEPRGGFFPEHLLTKKEKSKILNFLNNTNEIHRTSKIVKGRAEGRTLESPRAKESSTASSRLAGNRITLSGPRTRVRTTEKSENS